jgi:adenine-specific DNA methylase
MSEQTCPRLIEVALPIREISAESVRDKSLRHGHISTLHLWWARRPLAASRAVVFASLVPDPDDPNCPKAFKTAVEKNLKKEVPSALQYYTRGKKKYWDKDPYRPYEGMPDSLRNRLLCFVAKWSPEAIAFEKGENGKEPKPAELLDDRSLVKWETSDPENMQGKEILKIARELIRIAYNGKIPTVLDPFSGGGSIPLEAGRLGCQAIANDYNPVAYLILRATCEFPQKYGKPGKRKVEGMGDLSVSNVLVHDIEYWANWILAQAKEKIGHLYPSGEDKRSVVGYLWARTAPCSNTTCKGEMPLLRSLIVCNKPDKRVALTMDVDKAAKKVHFGIAQGNKIKQTEGTMQNRGNVLCPYCNQITPVADLRTAGKNDAMGERTVAVITEGRNGKEYRPLEETDLKAFNESQKIKVEKPQEKIYENIVGIPTTSIISPALYYGMPKWGDLFNPRQLVAIQTFVECLHKALDKMQAEIKDEEYRKAVAVYLGLWISRIAQRSSNVGIWHTSRETLEHPFGRQAIPMTWDYPEANPFSGSTGSAEGGVDWMKRVILHESDSAIPAMVNRGDCATLSASNSSIDVVATDPPYFDAIAYADLSDYFYVWLKRTLGDIAQEALITPLTPKADEATALRHRHKGDGDKADIHFRIKLSQALAEARRVLKPGGIVTVMFAHQSTKAWSALIRAIFDAELTVDATWPIDTEMISALKATMSSLSSSVTVICRPRTVGSAASFKDVRKEIEKVVQESVKRFWGYGFRGADLIVACYGPAVGVFGKYERVEKADGTPVEIPELLEFARKAARDAIAGEFKGDNLSTLYYVWANLYGAAEQAWDDARLVVQIGGDADDAMQIARSHGIFVVDGSKCRLALLADRANKKGLGADPNPPLIDALHHALLLWKEERRSDLVAYLSERGLPDEDPFWKLTQALFEVLPHETEDWKLVHALLGERETLRTEAKRGTNTGGLF